MNLTLPGPLQALGYQTFFQAVEGWREIAWRNAERLVSAPNAAARAVVAQQIDHLHPRNRRPRRQRRHHTGTVRSLVDRVPQMHQHGGPDRPSGEIRRDQAVP